MRNGPYILVVAPEDYPGIKYRNRYVYEHHLVWWRSTGESINTSKFVIHHKDENKHNNKITNLEKKTWGDHTREHSPEAEMVKLTCDWCNQPFTREARLHRNRVRNGYAHNFCCRSHQVSHQQSRRWKKFRGG